MNQEKIGEISMNRRQFMEKDAKYLNKFLKKKRVQLLL